MGKLVREGVGLAYQEAGSGAPPIVLVHDLGSDHTCLAAQFEHFNRRHRVVAVDLRGHGQSDKPRGVLSVAVLADDLAWLCYELGLYRPVVIGHGLGGMVALDLAARYHELPAAIVVLSQPAASRNVLPGHPWAGLLENIPVWAGTIDTEYGPIPVLRIAPGNAEDAMGSRPWAVTQPLESDSPEFGQLSQVMLADGINPLVQAFLTELPGRAPP